MGKRFGVLVCAPDDGYLKTTYGGLHVLFANMLSDPGETWDVYRVVEGELPEAKNLHSYQAFVITGSRFDAHGTDPWIVNLSCLLQTLHSMRIKLLGICFGHQILCRALGGTTGRASGGWDIGLTNITVYDRLFQKYPWLQIPPVINIIECHQDKVYTVPPGAEVLATSAKTGIEMFAIGDEVLGIQGHPEYTPDILLNLVDHLLDKYLVNITSMEEVRRSFLRGAPDSEVGQTICKSFLKGGVISNSSSHSIGNSKAVWKRGNGNWVMPKGAQNAANASFMVMLVVFVAFKCLGNNRFVNMSTENAINTCVSPSRDNLVKESVRDRRVSNIYNLSGICPPYNKETKNILLAEGFVTNNGCCQDTMAVQLCYSDKKTQCWNNTEPPCICQPVNMFFEAGGCIPVAESCGLKMQPWTCECSLGSVQWGQKFEEFPKKTVVHNVRVPPCKTAKVQLVATLAEFQVPFTYTQCDNLTNGFSSSENESNGLFVGSNYYAFEYKVSFC